MTEQPESLSIEHREKNLVDLVRLDYDATLRTVQGVLSTGVSIRAAGFAAWGVVLGVGVNADSWPFCLLASIVALLFGYVDLIHATLYRRALARATELESLLDSYVDRLGIDADDEAAIIKTMARFEMHKFGVYRTMPRMSPWRIWTPYKRARPAAVFWVIYPALIVVGLVATLVVAF